jgi:phosphoadenosine phosphosulfate reductase
LKAINKLAFLSHSKSNAYRKKLSKSKEVISKFLNVCENPCVSVSFGKDSQCMMHMIGNMKPDIKFIHCDRGEGGSTKEVIGICHDMAKIYNVVIVKTEVSNIYAYKNGIEIKKHLIKELEKAQAGHDGSAIGITRDESKIRNFVGLVNGQLFKMKSGIYRCYPIWNFSAIDVWAYIVSNDVPYPGVYDRLNDNGIKYASNASRTSDMIGENRLAQGRIHDTAYSDEETLQFYLKHGFL